MIGTNIMTISHFDVSGHVGVTVCSSERMLAPRVNTPINL